MLFRYLPLFFAISVFSAGPSYQAVKSDEGNSVHRFGELWIVTYMDENGKEVIAQAPAATGQMVPLMAADDGRLQSIIEAGKAIASKRQMKLRLIKFSQRTDIGEFKPTLTPLQ